MFQSVEDYLHAQFEQVRWRQPAESRSHLGEVGVVGHALDDRAGVAGFRARHGVQDVCGEQAGDAGGVVRCGVPGAPIDDLLVRANHAKGFRAPAIGELFGGTSQTFDSYLDPCDSVFGAAATIAEVAARCSADGLGADFRQTNSVGDPITSGGGGTAATAIRACGNGCGRTRESFRVAGAGRGIAGGAVGGWGTSR